MGGENMLTEDEKWKVIFDDPDYIEMYKEYGMTPEEASDMSTDEIEDLYEYNQRSKSDDTSAVLGHIILWFIGGMILIWVSKKTKLKEKFKNIFSKKRSQQ